MKLVSTNWKYLKYLFWLSPMLIIMGISAGIVAQSWSAVPLGLIIAGIAIAIAWLAISGQSVRMFWGRRSTQASTNALIATLAMVVILGLINFLGVRYDKRVDLTENQLFTLSPQSVEVVKAVRQPVKVWVFDSNPNTQDRELLERYHRQNSQVTYEYADPQAKPGLVQKFGVQSMGEVYVEAGEKRKLIQTVRPEQRTADGQIVDPGERLSERSLTNGLATLSSDRQSKVYFLQGHGEKSLQGGQNGLSEAIAQLGQENYTAEPLNLAAAAKIPEDASVVVIAGPQRQLLPTEVKALQDYLKRKSGLMLLLDPLSKPGLGDLLKQWGVTLSDRVILDPSSQAAGLGPTVALVTQYGDHPITKEFGNGISFYPIAQPLQIVDTPDEAEIPLLFASERAQAQPVAADGQLNFDPNSPPQAPLALGVALSKTVGNAANQANASPTPSPAGDATAPKPDQPEARIVVIGNSGFIADRLFSQQLNGDVFSNSVNWLSQQGEQTLSIRPKEMTNRRILLDAQQQTLIGGGALLLLPLLGFGFAFFSWWRRR